MFNQCVHCEAPSGSPCDENCITRLEEEAPETEPVPKVRVEEEKATFVIPSSIITIVDPPLCKKAYYGIDCDVPNCRKCAELKLKAMGY